MAEVAKTQGQSSRGMSVRQLMVSRRGLVACLITPPVAGRSVNVAHARDFESPARFGGPSHVQLVGVDCATPHGEADCVRTVCALSDVGISRTPK